MKRKREQNNTNQQGQKFFKSAFNQANREISIGNLALSTVINSHGHYKTAISHYEQALKLIDNLTEYDQVDILDSINTSLTNFNTSLESHAQKDPKPYAKMKYRLGMIYQKRNREKALQYFNAAVPYFRSNNNIKYAEIETRLANICHHKGKITDMIIHCNNATPTLKASYPEAYQKMLEAICQALNEHDKNGKIWGHIKNNAHNLSEEFTYENGKFNVQKLPSFDKFINPLQLD